MPQDQPDSVNYGALTEDRLKDLCRERGLPFGPNTPKRSLINILRSGDQEAQKLAGLKLVAAALQVTVPSTANRAETERVLDPLALTALTADGYFVEGELGKPFNITRERWAATGTVEQAGGFIKLLIRLVNPDGTLVRGSLQTRIGAAAMYQTIHMPDTVAETQTRRVRWRV